ncbi:hypothetical protein L6452_04024 [Arctium lappa]|uniref:Uncharacterized protein n=1 Tax=Arctium lappa TaxID=4217 RepID=A0ACB9FNX1_ARCLA|nr:hypothetical protein L6452_04024 [Arctium lappa]
MNTTTTEIVVAAISPSQKIPSLVLHRPCPLVVHRLPLLSGLSEGVVDLLRKRKQRWKKNVSAVEKPEKATVGNHQFDRETKERNDWFNT